MFLGNYSPESAGDYASGTNHTLPTHGYAKAYSGVNVDAFVKKNYFSGNNTGKACSIWLRPSGLWRSMNFCMHTGGRWRYGKKRESKK